MPRPTKCRKVCNLPTIQGFAPGEVGKNTKAVILTIDEYETIRLIDREGFFQEECSALCRLHEQRFSKFTHVPEETCHSHCRWYSNPH